MKKIMIILMGAISLTCGNSVKLDDTYKEIFVEETKTEQIDAKELAIETVQSSNDEEDEYEEDQYGDFIYDHEYYEDIRGYLPKVAQKWAFDRFDLATISNEEFDEFAKANLIDCGTIVVTDGEYTEGYRVFVDKYERGPYKAETYFVRDNTYCWTGTVDVTVLWSYEMISVRGYDNIHELCE